MYPGMTRATLYLDSPADRRAVRLALSLAHSAGHCQALAARACLALTHDPELVARTARWEGAALGRLWAHLLDVVGAES